MSTVEQPSYSTDTMNLPPGECPPPGIYHGVPAATYHSWPAISSSLLKNYAILPSTAREPYVPGPDVAVGTGIHSFTLQGQAGLDEECIIGPHLGKGKADQEILRDIQESNPTKTILPAFYGTPAPGVPIMDVLTGVDLSLRLHKKIGPILANSQKEVSLVWEDLQTGVMCKARLDIWDTDNLTIWDLKKVRSIVAFPWQIKDLCYGTQAGHYTNGARALGLNPVAFGFIPIEAFPPYQVACGYRDPDKLEIDCMEAVRLVGLVKQSQLTGNWPNYPIPSHIFDLDEITPDDLIGIY